jgi:hypothetical protein
MTSKILIENTYCSESIVDIEQHIFDCIDDLPVDEHGFFEGNIKVVVYYEV